MLKGISELKLYLQKKFQIKDLEQLQYFMDIEVARSKKGIFLSQRKYVDMLFDAGVLGCRPVDSPVDAKGKLNYLTVTRPDVHSLLVWWANSYLLHGRVME